MSGYPFALALCAATLVFIVYLLRSGQLREKYAAIWLVVLVAMLLVGAFPRALFRLAAIVGVQTPTNLLFAASVVMLLLVCIQLSTEISQLEEDTRTIAEELALLNRHVEEIGETTPSTGPGEQESEDPAPDHRQVST